MSPRSLEHMQNISSGISQLVDDVVSPTLDSSKIEDSMNNLRVSNLTN